MGNIWLFASVEVETSVNNLLERVILDINWIHYRYLSFGQCLVHITISNTYHVAIINTFLHCPSPLGFGFQ